MPNRTWKKNYIESGAVKVDNTEIKEALAIIKDKKNEVEDLLKKIKQLKSEKQSQKQETVAAKAKT